MVASLAKAAAREAWQPLFNGRDLAGWYVFLSKSGKIASAREYVHVERRMLHVLDQEPTDSPPEFGYIVTEQEFSNYHLRLEYRWGGRRFPPRSIWKRDNGILYHVIGADNVWPMCMEFQIQETDVGDVVAVSGTRERGTVRFAPGAMEGVGPPGLASWPNPPTRPGDPNFTLPLVTRAARTGDLENRNGWNVLELICIGDRSAHLVNGTLVGSAFNIQVRDAQDPARSTPLARGRIGLEVNFAETWFRNIEIRPLPA